MGPRLILLCGLPCSGKTTEARRLERELPAVRLCPDEWLTGLGLDPFDGPARDRVEAVLWRHAQALLAAGTAVVLEYGFWDRGERDEKRLRARELGVPVELRYLTAPLPELQRRAELRNREPGAIALTAAQMAEYAAMIEEPTPEELALYD
ncbi:hypothetical protein Afil01_48010 [Actinorhabdospora filicis]|uniref:ATP-binding protein n=1 Tax=Actinorhabdospora filicis TaxID=1785913 RepID=A0A9W6SN68_9ACTN|nr:ATP-binding protein [Actinorhabdospora filicis]GLZ79994.1 hypothetical protein Afil01_48010 [Actinorhabdospora filicis]